ncbi:hypothetical protein NPX13_g723 [Xylaria arbuscula]|uniref:DNA-directed DNA polymerase n=1 Tax=Xylaria arbuscula TaxID=114810 RepID=A0A9W8TQ96_9PEZI|nr:hypothetical protein NPX13_g723 [Xylaria arbuscula]
MVSDMDPSLKEKRAFFEQLDACRHVDEEADTLSPEEQAFRQECKAFCAAAAVRPTRPARPVIPAKSASDSVRLLRYPTARLPPLRHRRIASDSALKPVDKELEIIAVTPATNRTNAPATTASSPVRATSITDSIIPETERQPNNKRRTQGGINPNKRVLRSQSNLEPSPSVSMAKRKQTKPLQMAPEAEQIFRGLRFFYIPNNDIDRAQKMRITKAQEYGATWTRDIADATHVIVDAALKYGDIKSTLGHRVNSLSFILANDRYPIECVQRKTVFDPNTTVEKYKFQVPEDPRSIDKPPEEPTVPQPSTHDSSTSLKIKERKDARRTANDTQESTQRSVELIPSSHPEEIRSSKASARTSSRRAQAPPIIDDLTACIDAVLDDPEEHAHLDESDQDDRDLENGSPQRKRRRTRSGVNNADTNFGHDKFMCMRGGTRDKKLSGPNSDVIALLEEMVEEHILSDETWRVHSYRKAIATLRRQPKKIMTAKEATALPNIGKSLANHIEEIVKTGHFQKLDEIRREPAREALKTFCNVYGVGVPTAQKWVESGYRTLDDLREKAGLSPNQRIGVEHYDDLLTRIPRAEVKALGDHVKDVAATIDPSVELIISGSYRRGAETSGDIDLITTKAGTTSTQDLMPFLEKLVGKLKKDSFLTAALAEHHHNGGNKWHGCCVLPRTAFPGPEKEYRPIWRRIDFLLVPETEIGGALVYFTGNDLFNRSMRLLARKKKMKLNHRGLFGPGVDEGRDEKKIFEILGVKWREPHERWC